MNDHPWFSPRGYQHLDSAIGRVAAERIATTPAQVAHHEFLPLIGFEKKSRRYSAANGKAIKIRPILYASHADCAVYSYYAHELGQQYETWLSENGVSSNVIAYRKLGRSNIDFAQEAFAEVERRGATTALCFDIESFFPSLDHSILQLQMQRMLGTSRLSDDWFSVFRSVTKYAWIGRQDIERARGAKLTSARDGRAISVQQLHDLRGRGLVHRNPDRHGIPQGLPISSLLANIYMAEFDLRLAASCNTHGAFLRRYSDDILVVCDTAAAVHFRETVEAELARLHLRSNAAKFEQSTFLLSGNRRTCDIPLQYLGFDFDGERARIRSSSLSRFYRRMAKAVRGVALKAAASIQAGRTSKLHRRRLYSKFSVLGNRNFLTGYAAKAASMVGPNDIANQTKRASRILKRRIAVAEEKFIPKA